ncbi:MAG: chorismate lyase [Gammaproteobacteria bacterium]
MTEVTGKGQLRRGATGWRRTGRETGPWRWLRDAGSLTARLRAGCPGPFRVRVVHHSLARPQSDEAALLGLRRAEQALVREVVLTTGGVPRVFARSVVPLRTLRRMGHLGRIGCRPLGAKLFADGSLRRRLVQCTRLRRGHPLRVRATASVAMRGEAPLWGRRTLFEFRGWPLLVNELFLPAIGECRPPGLGSRGRRR